MAIKVTWSQAGAPLQKVVLLEELPLEDFLMQVVEVGKDGFEIMVNGRSAGLDDMVEDGDTITLNPKKSYNG